MRTDSAGYSVIFVERRNQDELSVKDGTFFFRGTGEWTDQTNQKCDGSMAGYLTTVMNAYLQGGEIPSKEAYDQTRALREIENKREHERKEALARERRRTAYVSAVMSAVSVNASKTSPHRVTHCYCCPTTLSSRDRNVRRCKSCGWMMCPKGSCGCKFLGGQHATP